MGRYRNNYFKNYEAVKIPSDNKRGYRIQYEYIGDYALWDESEEQMLKKKIQYSLTEVIIIAIFIACAVPGVYINRQPFVAIPGIGAIAALLYCCIGTFQFVKLKGRIKLPDMEEMQRKFSISHIIFSFFMVFASVSGIIIMLGTSEDTYLISTLIIIGYICAAVLGFYLSRSLKKIKYHIEK